MEISLGLDFGSGAAPLRAGLLWAEGLRWPDDSSSIAPEAVGDADSDTGTDTDSYAGILAAAAESGEAGEGFWPDGRRAAVRHMLRYGKYRPAGRAKPSSEYLLQAARSGDYPRIGAIVDAANLTSLHSGYPISIFDIEKSGSDLVLRRGRPGESYVFNASGQSIDVEDLICVCRAAGGGPLPCANPVRDSMATKLFPGARSAVAVIYAPTGSAGADLEESCRDLARRLGGMSLSPVLWRIVE
ncbi:MAG: phenylalanine--tRNA ligase beta subunit-related protein [Rectinemataceae bacterium]